MPACVTPRSASRRSPSCATVFAKVVARGVTVKMSLNHGVSLAFYFDDPEGNMIEIYRATGLAYGQPYGHPIDLTQPEEALLRDIEALAARHGLAWQRVAALER